MNGDVDPEAQARIERNMELGALFFRLLFDRPEMMDHLPNGAMLFLDPENDPAFAAISLEGAERARRLGRLVHVQHLSAAEIEAAQALGTATGRGPGNGWLAGRRRWAPTAPGVRAPRRDKLRTERRAG